MQYVYFYSSQALRLFFLCKVYPAAMAYRHMQQDRNGGNDYRTPGTTHMRKTIEKTPVDKLKDMLVTAAEMDL